MAAIPLNELLAGQQRLKAKDAQANTTERMSMEEFRALKQQGADIKSIDSAVNDTTGTGLNSNVIKLKETIDRSIIKTPKKADEKTSASPKTTEGAADIKSYGQVLKNWFAAQKKSFTSIEGYIDLEKGKSTGLLGDLARARVAKRDEAAQAAKPATDQFVEAAGATKKKMAAPLEAVQSAKASLVGNEETQQEALRTTGEQTAILSRIEANTAAIPQLIEIMRGAKPQAPSSNSSEQKGVELPTGGSIKSLGRGLAKIGRGAMGIGRAALGFVGGGSVAMGAAVIGGAVGAGYLGHKYREHVQEKEAANRAQEQKEITENKIDAGELSKLPDEGKAIAPGTINKVDRARNLMEQRVEAKQSFTEEEAKLAKQKLGVDVPKELIGKKDGDVASEASQPSAAEKVSAEVSEAKFMEKDPETFSKFSEERQTRTKAIIEENLKKIESTKYKTERDKEIAVKAANGPAAKRSAYAKATIELYKKYSKEIQAAGAGSVTAQESGKQAAQASEPTSGSTALQQAETAVGGAKTSGEIVAGASMAGAGVRQQVGLTQAGVERNATQASEPTQAQPVATAPITSAQVTGKQTGDGRFEGTLSGVTSDDIVNNPNYKKYYEQALHGRTGPDAVRMAKKSASMKIQSDMVKAAAQPSQAADGVYQQSADNKAKEQAPSSVVNAPVVNAPTTNVQQTTNNAVRNPARNTESSQQWYNRSKFAF